MLARPLPGSRAAARDRRASGGAAPPASGAAPKRPGAGGVGSSGRALGHPLLLLLLLAPLRPPENPAALGRAAPLAGPESEPARDEAAVPRPGPPACPVEAARDGEVHVRALVVGAASDELDPRTEPCP